jgi:hypothetical protein
MSNMEFFFTWHKNYLSLGGKFAYENEAIAKTLTGTRSILIRHVPTSHVHITCSYHVTSDSHIVSVEAIIHLVLGDIDVMEKTLQRERGMVLY